MLGKPYNWIPFYILTKSSWAVSKIKYFTGISQDITSLYAGCIKSLLEIVRNATLD
jgi:hypothetical protein